jgi:VRR-NUC domain
MTTTRWTLDRHMSEPAFQRQVLQLAHLCGWLTYHTLDSRGSEPGFPDLVLVRPPRLLFAELKTQTGRVSQAQRRWLHLLGQCPGVEVHLWRPGDWDEIETTLRLPRRTA